MLFAFTATDKPDSLQLRLDTRPEHVVFLKDLNDKGTLKFAGPFLDEAGKPCGSLVVLETETAEETRKIMAGDPYAKAGLFAATEVRGWNWVFNNPANPANP